MRHERLLERPGAAGRVPAGAAAAAGAAQTDATAAAATGLRVAVARPHMESSITAHVSVSRDTDEPTGHAHLPERVRLEAGAAAALRRARILVRPAEVRQAAEEGVSVLLATTTQRTEAARRQHSRWTAGEAADVLEVLVVLLRLDDVLHRALGEAVAFH